MTQINPQGQITIPDEIQIEVVGETLHLRKKPAPSRGARLVQTMRGKATNRTRTDDIMQLTRNDE